MIAGGDDSRGPGFDYIAEFAVAMPVLSVGAVDEVTSSPSVERPVGLLAVQAAAIQQYTLDPVLCTPPAPSSATPPGTPGAAAR